MTTIPVELLPCPFCGGDAETDTHSADCYFTVYADMMAKAERNADLSGVPAVLKAWNRRALLSEQPQAGVGQECGCCGRSDCCDDDCDAQPAAQHDQGDEVRRLLEAGNPLSNAAYNLAQHQGRTLDQNDCELLSSLRKRWDAAVAALTQSTKGAKE